jgi:hypothetical protein
MSEVKVNKISPRTNCGTVQLGDSGDTITIPAGATITNNGTQTGFGRTGTVDWDTTKKTANFTAVSGDGFFTDTSGGAFTATLPASPSAGDIVAVADYANTWNTNNLTIGRNSSNIEGEASDLILNVAGASITFIYVDSTKGWVTANSGNSTDASDSQFITATGGTVTTCGNFKIHTFTGPGTFCVSCAGGTVGSNSVDYLVLAGGGAGGGNGPGTPTSQSGGGGGAGGIRVSNGTASGCYSAGPSPLAGPVSALPVSAQGYPITVGGGGALAAGCSAGGSGANSVFSTITSAGGGGGGGAATPASPGANGGSGGGATKCTAAGSGNTPPVSPPQGNNGGGPGTNHAGGGGGLNAGSTSPGPRAGGAGGDGFASSITGSSITRAGGGGGGLSLGAPEAPLATGGAGGAGGGGNGQIASDIGTPPANGTTNKGGGGGGAGDAGSNGGAGTGGSGIVIIRYKFQ